MQEGVCRSFFFFFVVSRVLSLVGSYGTSKKIRAEQGGGGVGEGGNILLWVSQDDFGVGSGKELVNQNS